FLFTSDLFTKEKREFFIPRLNRESQLYGNECISKKVENHLQIKGLSIDEVRDNFICQLLDIEDISNN
ncbi:hypothetical protein IGK73_002468, partial [Enterococcus sp. AZ102]